MLIAIFVAIWNESRYTTACQLDSLIISKGFKDFFRVQNQTSGTGNMSCVKKSPKRVCKIWFFIASALMISMQTYRKRLEYLRQHFLTSFDTDIFKICRFIMQIFHMHTDRDSIRSQTASLTALNVSLMFQNQS